MINAEEIQQAEVTGAAEQGTGAGRRWWVAALWSLISPPTAFLYVGLPGWAYAGYLGTVVWVVFCLATGFEARVSGLLAMLCLLLAYSTIPVLVALARRHHYQLRSYNNLRRYLITLAVSLFAMTFIMLASERITGLDNYIADNASMARTLLPGDYILVDSRAYDRSAPQRHDLVVFVSPDNPRSIKVKRVVGLPGDTLRMKYKLLYLNGKMVNTARTATYTDSDRIFPAEMSPRDNFGPVVVPQGEYFVLGDSRDDARDSRYWGPVPREMIKGQAKIVYYSREGLITRLERIWLRLDR